MWPTLYVPSGGSFAPATTCLYCIEKAVTESRTGTSLANDAELLFTTKANTLYRFVLEIRANRPAPGATSTADLTWKVAHSGDTTALCLVSCSTRAFNSNPGAAPQSYIRFRTLAANGALGTAPLTGDVNYTWAIMVEGSILTGAATGTFAFQWNEGGGANAAEVLAGSRLYYQEVAQ